MKKQTTKSPNWPSKKEGKESGKGRITSLQNLHPKRNK